MNPMYTHEELQTIVKPILTAKLEQFEKNNPNLKGVPPLTYDEARDYLLRFTDMAQDKVLTADEAGLFGQMLAQFEQAVIAKYMGKKGRFFVIPEEKIKEMMDGRA